MEKDFKRWTEDKIRLNDSPESSLFQEREIWWCTLGANVGTEQDGSPKRFERPVIIVKKFNLESCLIIPLTGRLKVGRYYFPLGVVADREATAILSQIRFVDQKRLTNKIGILDIPTFQNLLERIIETCLTL